MANKIICGQMKEGKTTLAQYLARCHSNGVVGWDPRNMMEGITCHNADELEDAIHSREAQEQTVRYVPQTGEIDEEFHTFCSVVFPPEFTLRQFSCIIDEAAQLQRTNSIHPALDRAVRQHPRDVLLIQTTHSMQDYFRSSKDLMNDLYCFKLKGRSLEAVIEYCDADDSMREAITTLPPHCLVHYSFERHCGPEFEVWNDPSVWYVPLNPEAQSIQNSGSVGQSAPDAARGEGFTPPRPVREDRFAKWVH